MRLFIACLPPEKTINLLTEIYSGIKTGLNNIQANWVPINQLHINLHFLGDIKDERVDELKDILRGLAAAQAGTKVRLNQLLAFPNPSNCRVLTLKVEQIDDLKNLALAIQQRIAGAKIAPAENRVYRPHVTLARVKSLLNQDEKNFVKSFKYEPIDWPLNSFALIRSYLTSLGPKHEVLEEFILSGR